jgi:hypothetical protein
MEETDPILPAQASPKPRAAIYAPRPVGYGKRSLGETAVFRYKAIIGRRLRAWTLPAQKSEVRAACAVLNRMTRLGMPVSQRIA